MARTLNGTSDYLNVANSPSLQPLLGSFAVSLWMKRGRTTATEVVLSCGNLVSGNVGYTIFLSTGGVLTLRVSDGTTIARLDFSAFTDIASWHNIILVIDRSSNVITGYFDGSASGFTPNTSASIAGFATLNPTLPMYVGSNSTPANFLQGSVGPITLLRGRIPTAQEISDIASGKPAHQVWGGYELAKSWLMVGSNLDEFASPTDNAPLVASGTTVLAAGPAQTWAINTETVWEAETFTDANGTDITAHPTPGGRSWIYHPFSGASAGTLQIQSNALVRPTSSTSATIAYVNSPVPARGVARIRADFALSSTAGLTDQSIGFMARFDPNANTYVGFVPNSAGTWNSSQKIGGTGQPIVTGEVYTAAVGTYSLTMQVDNVFYYLFQGSKLLNAFRQEDSTVRDLPINPGFRYTGAAENSPAYWSADNLTVEYPFPISTIAQGTYGSNSAGTYAGYHLPSIIKTNNYIIYVAEGRYGTVGDNQVRDLVLWRASKTSPLSFGSKITAVGDGSSYASLVANPTCFVLANGTTIVMLFAKYPVAGSTFPTSGTYENSAVAGLTGSTATVWKTTSTDEGATWSTPVEITSSVKNSSEAAVTLGPGPGVRMVGGATPGRLISCYGYTTAPGSPPTWGDNGTIYSDDGGSTWHRGGAVSTGHARGEGSISQLANGNLLMMNRTPTTDADGRIYNISTDGGVTWGADTTTTSLRAPTLDNGSVFTAYTPAYAGGVYSYPNAQRRERMTLRYSPADLSSWSDPMDRVNQAGRISGGTMVERSLAAYSHAVPHTVGGIDYILLAYNGANRAEPTSTIAWEDRLTVAQVPRTWLGLATSNATGYSLSASPGSVAVGTPTTITAALTGGTALSASLVITLADDHSGTIGGTITIASGSTTGSTTINPSATGTHAVTASHTGGGFSGGDGSTSFVATSAPVSLSAGSASIGPVALTSVVVNWTSPSGGTAPYSNQLQKSANGTTGWSNVGSATSGTTGTATGLSQGTQYYFRVVQADSASGSVTTSVVSGTTLSPLVAGAAALGAVGINTVAVTWTNPSGGATPYSNQLQISTDGGSTWANVGSPTTGTSGIASGLSPGTAYNFRVAQYDSQTSPATVATNSLAATTATSSSSSLSDADVAKIVTALQATSIPAVVVGIVDSSTDPTSGGAQAAANLKATFLQADVPVTTVASAVRTEMDANSTRLAHVTGDVALASQIPAGFTPTLFASPGVLATAALANAPASTAPTAAQVRAEMDANSTKLAFLTATVPTAAQVRAEMDANSARLANLTGPAALASQIPSAFTPTLFASPGVLATAALANAPTSSGGATAAAIRQEMDTNSTKLAFLTATVPTATAIRQEIDANSTKLAQVTGAFVGSTSVLAQASLANVPAGALADSDVQKILTAFQANTIPAVMVGMGDASTDPTTGGGTALANLKATMLGPPVVVADVAAAAATATANLVGVLGQDSGAVAASPTPTTTTFSATGAKLTAGPGGYAGMFVLFQGNAGQIRRLIIGHAVVGSRHDFITDPANPMPTAPTANESFILG